MKALVNRKCHEGDGLALNWRVLVVGLEGDSVKSLRKRWRENLAGCLPAAPEGDSRKLLQSA